MLVIFGRTLLIFGFLATKVVSSIEIEGKTHDGLVEECGSSTPPDKFFKIGTKYYRIELEKEANWFEAAHICRTQNAELANIATQAEMIALSNYLETIGHAELFWISGNDLGQEGSYFSIATGKPISYSRWSKGQPRRLLPFIDEDCMHLLNRGAGYEMNDFMCEVKLFYICQANEPKTIVFTVW